MPKASTKAAPVVTTKTIAIPQAVTKCLAVFQSAESAHVKATNAKSKSLLELAQSLAAWKADSEAIKEAFRPVWFKSYGIEYKANKDGKMGPDSAHDEYNNASSQWSRLFGVTKTLRGENENKKALAQLEKGIENDENWNTLLGLSNGSLAHDKKGEIQRVEKSAGNTSKGNGSGGSNRIKPADAWRKLVDDGVTAATKGKMDPLGILIPVLEAMTACELLTEEEAQAIQDAIEENV